MADSESEDSENEGSMGNLCRAVMRPPGHSGKAKKGHLCFDASFETGNLGLVELVSQYEYDLFIRPDTCNPRLRLWFNFTVDNTKPEQVYTEPGLSVEIPCPKKTYHSATSQVLLILSIISASILTLDSLVTNITKLNYSPSDYRVILNIVNFSMKRNCFLNGMTPIVKSTSRPAWQRMPGNKVFYHSSPYHNNNYILSLALNFDKEEDVYHIAFSYPYSYSKCQAHLDMLERRGLPHFKRELLAQSLQKRRLDLLTITEPGNMRPENGKVQAVVILARVHPGESPASFVCQGIIDFLISNHPTAVLLREKVVFKIIPMLNPDGVFLGNHRCSLVGADLNRTWNKISKWLHPTIYAAYSYICSLEQDKNIDLDIILDLHAHSNLRGVFISGNTYNDVYRYERHIVFPKQLSQNILGYESSYSVFNRDINKAGSSRRLLCDLLKSSINCYSLIVSFHGYCSAKNSTFKYYTEETYYKVGRNVVKTFYDYYKGLGVIEPIVKTVEKKMPRGRLPMRGARTSCRSRSAPGRVRTGRIAILDLHLDRAYRRKPRSQEAKPKNLGPLAQTPPAPASLSIIDFNSMTRTSLLSAGGIVKSRKRGPEMSGS